MHTENNSGQNYSESPAIASRALAVSTRARFPMSTAEPQGPVCPRGRPQPSVLLQLRACFSGVDGTPPPPAPLPPAAAAAPAPLVERRNGRRGDGAPLTLPSPPSPETLPLSLLLPPPPSLLLPAALLAPLLVLRLPLPLLPILLLRERAMRERAATTYRRMDGGLWTVRCVQRLARECVRKWRERRQRTRRPTRARTRLECYVAMTLR